MSLAILLPLTARGGTVAQTAAALRHLCSPMARKEMVCVVLGLVGPSVVFRQGLSVKVSRKLCRIRTQLAPANDCRMRVTIYCPANHLLLSNMPWMG